MKIYDKLYEESKTVKKSFVLLKFQRNIWEDKKLRFLKNEYELKITQHQMDLQEQVLEKD